VIRETGTVKWFNGERGYGFIRPEDGGEDLFVHHTGIAGTGFKYLVEGERVAFEAYPARRSVEARNVSRI
jgi:cold shock protein